MKIELSRKLFLLTAMLFFAVLISGCRTIILEEESELEKLMKAEKLREEELMKRVVKIDSFSVTGVTEWIEEIGAGMIDGEYSQHFYLDENGDTISRQYSYSRVTHTNYEKWLEAANQFNAKVEIFPNPTSSFAIISLKNVVKFPVSFKYRLVFDEKIIHTFENPNCFGTETIPENLLQKNGIYRIIYAINDAGGEKENVISFWVQKQ